MRWLNTPAHARWLEAETDRTFEFGRGAKVEHGFGWLNNQGVVRDDKNVELWITSRMVHVYSLAALMGRPGAAAFVDHGIRALNEPLNDDENGGWFAEISVDGPVDTTKAGYAHCFVLLGAASATAAERPGARELLDRAIDVFEQHFWDEANQVSLESWNADWSETEDYRGGNVNMHAVEAFLVIADVTGDDKWLHRAVAIADRIIHHVARENNYRVVEHFDEELNPLYEYNTDNRAHRFRAYGGTPGHWTEWARLLLSLRASLLARGLEAPTWLLDDAVGVFDAAVRDAWEPDGNPGFVYSVGWDGEPVVRERIRWVVVEAMGGAAALHSVTGDDVYEQWYQRFWDYAKNHLIDTVNGSWWQELSPENAVSTEVWDGKPDIYHLMHCLLVPRLPLAPAMAPALAAGLLDSVNR
jgi:sulfoquinovose isomerase